MRLDPSGQRTPDHGGGAGTPLEASCAAPAIPVAGPRVRAAGGSAGRSRQKHGPKLHPCASVCIRGIFFGDHGSQPLNGGLSQDFKASWSGGDKPIIGKAKAGTKMKSKTQRCFKGMSPVPEPPILLTHQHPVPRIEPCVTRRPPFLPPLCLSFFLLCSLCILWALRYFMWVVGPGSERY